MFKNEFDLTNQMDHRNFVVSADWTRCRLAQGKRLRQRVIKSGNNTASLK
jgi:hypothetical protein